MLSGTFSKLIPSPFLHYQLLCVKAEHVWSLQRWCAAPAIPSAGQAVLTGEFLLLMNLSPPIQQEAGEQPLGPTLPRDPYLWEISVFTSARRRVNPRDCMCIHLFPLRLLSFFNRKRELFSPEFSFEHEICAWANVNKEEKEKRVGNFSTRIQQSLVSAFFICIKLVTTFQVSLRLKCLLDHF